MTRLATPLAVAVALAMLPPPPARAGTPLEAEMAELARQIGKELGRRGGTAILVGEFTGPANLASTGGPRIVAALTAQLEKAGVSVSRKAALRVRGDYRPTIDSASDLASVGISSRLEEVRTGKQLVEFESRGLFDLTEMSAVTGATLTAPVGGTKAAREDAIAKALDEVQPAHRSGTRIAASAKSPYALEILVGPDPGHSAPDPSTYRPRAPAVDGAGLAFVKIGRGEVYAVRIINDAGHDAAVTLTVDGLSMFAFSDARAPEVVIIPAGKSGTIAGWFRNKETSDAFQVSGYARSAAAAAMPNSSSIGTIHASFRAAWPKDGTPPADEPRPEPTARDADATARGKTIGARYSEADRSIGKLREAVAVRYNKAAEPSDLPDSKPTQ